MDTGKIVLGILGGVAVGAAIGILFAPAKGSVTRKKISATGEDYVDDLSEKLHDIINNIGKQIDSLKEEVKIKSENGKMKVKDAANQAADAVNAM